MCRMRPNLMRATCLQMTLHQGDRPEALKDFIMCDGRLSHLTIHRIDSHLQTVFRVPAYVARDGTRIVSKWSPNKGIVLASASVVEELLCQVCLGICGLGHDQQPAGILVNAVYKSNGRVIGVKVFVVAQVPSQSIDQCTTIVAAPRMHHKTCRLVDDKQGIILIDDIKGQVLGDDFPVALGVVKDKGDDVACLDLVIAFDGFVVGPDASCLSSLLYAVAAGAGHVVHQELIDADGALPLVHLNAPMLVALIRLFLQKRVVKFVIKQYVFQLFNVLTF